MEGLLNLLSIYTENENQAFDLREFLEMCKVHQSFDVQDVNEADCQHALGVINAKLNDAETRLIGAQLLNLFVTQCGTDIFTTNCISWTQQIFKLLQGSHNCEETLMSCQVLTKLIQYSSEFSEISRHFGTNMISQLVNTLCDEKYQKMAQTSESVLGCLKSMMKHYNSACGPHKSIIERYLLTFVDMKYLIPESSLQSIWASCFALLASLGGSGTQGAQHKTNWVELYSQVLGSIQRCIDNMLKHVDELKIHQPLPSALKLPTLKHTHPMVLLQLERKRFLNLSAILEHLLKDTFTTTKNISIDQLLEVISRLMSFNSKSLTKLAQTNFERLTLGSIVPDLQTAALKILFALITVSRGQLIIRASVVMSYFIQILEWTFTPVDRRRVGAERPYSKLRTEAYLTLSTWVSASRSACGLAKYADAFFTQILSDITVHRDTVQLMTANQQNSRTSRKGKKALDAPVLIVHKIESEANSDICNAALKCLLDVLLYCGARIKPAIHKEMQETVLSILVDIMKGTPLKALLPYNDPRCRAGLYRVLQRLIVCANPQWPAPLNYATTIFSIGLNDPNLEVSRVCAQGLVSMQGLIRPRGPTANFALEESSMKSVLETAPLMSALTYSKSPAPCASAFNAPLRLQESIPQMTPEPVQLPLNSSISSAIYPEMLPSPLIEPRQSQPSPESATNGTRFVNCKTPPDRISTIVTETPVEPERIMTRKEALKVIASASKQNDVKSEATSPSNIPKTSTRKRPSSPELTTDPPQEKILKELPYGTDEVDDDLEAMLASFRDVPAE